METPEGSALRRSPAASDRAVSSNDSGSTVTISAPGLSAVTARAIPAVSPPPLHGTSTRSSTAPSRLACRHISSPTVPWPAIVQGWSYGGTRVAPVSAAMVLEISSRDSRSLS
jgi:hypothetical protein